MSIEGKVVIVTGAGSGIGRAVAQGFYTDRASVIGLDVNRAGIEETKTLCGLKMLTLSGDVRAEDDVSKLVEITLERFGRIDVLFNNAGISDGGAFTEIPFQQWLNVIQVNLIGAALCMHHVLPVMLKQKYGRIINVVSRGAESVSTRASAYSASKAGLVSLTKTIASIIDRQQYPDVLINGLIPGMTRTAIWDRAIELGALPATTLQQLQEPEVVYPYARNLVELPPGGPTGRIFFNSQDYPVFSRFNDTVF